MKRGTQQTVTLADGRKAYLIVEDLHGLPAWTVYHQQVMRGWVIQRSLPQSKRRCNWAYVLPPESKEDEFDSIVYQFATRHQAVLCLLGAAPDSKGNAAKDPATS